MKRSCKNKTFKTKQSAFTLIELLAVILVLSLLSLIAVPIVSNVIAESKKNSFGVTCQQVYQSLQKFASFQAEHTCVVFDFSKDITESEMIDGVNYQPLTKLQLKGKLPTTGQARICDGVIEVKAGDEELTCLVTEEVSNVLSKPIGEVDLTDPILESITLTSTTSTIKVVVNANDEDGEITKYFYSLNGKDFVDSTSASHTFTGLKADKEYSVYVRVENASGLVSKKMVKKVKTKVLEIPSFEPPKQEEGKEEFEYFEEYTLKIEFPSEGVDNPEYYFKSTTVATVKEGVIVAICGTDTIPKDCIPGTVTELEPNVWYKTNDPNLEVNYKTNGTLYVYVTDGVNELPPATFVVTGVDPTGPICQIILNDEDIKTSQITVKADCYDLESGMAKYEFSNDGGATWKNNGKNETYTFKELISSTNYTFKIRGSNGSGMTSEDSKSATPTGFKNPTMEESARVPDDKDANGVYKYDYATSRTIKITYNDSKIVTPEYYFKTSVGATVSAGVTMGACGAGVLPNPYNSSLAAADRICVPTDHTTLIANVWYKTNKVTPEIIYASDGTLYAVTGDGTNVSGTATYVISNVDVSEPNASLVITDEKTSSTSLKATCTDQQSRIIKYEFSKDNGTTWSSNNTTNTYTFTGLKQGTDYTYKVRCTNGTGVLMSEATATAKVPTIKNPTISEVSTVPADKNTYKYYTNVTVKATYDITNISDPVYYFKASVDATVPNGTVLNSCVSLGDCTGAATTNIVANTWYKSNANPQVTFANNGTFYAATGDGSNISGTATYTVSGIDATAPDTASIAISIKKVDRTSVIATCNDQQSGIIKYEFSKDGNNWTSTGTTNTYTFTGLTSGTAYTYHVRCTNGANTTKTASVTDVPSVMSKPIVEISSQTISSGYTYYQSRTAKITYSSSNVSTPTYYFKSNVSATTVGGTVISACGSGATPANCAGSATTTLTANVWYQTSSLMPLITFTQNGTLTALISDGTTAYTTDFAVTNIDTTKPTVTLASLSGYNAKFTLADNVGIKNYAVTTATSTPSSWTASSGTSKTVDWAPTYGAYGTYYMHVEDVAGNTAYVKVTIAASSFDYAATPTCSGGRVLSNGNCVYTYTNNEGKCGCKERNSCVSTSCSCNTYNSQANESVCGCAVYKSQQNGAYCGYSACSASATEYCPSGTLTSDHRCKTSPCPYSVSYNSSGGKYCSSGYYVSGTSCCYDNYTSSSYSCSKGTLSGTTCQIAASSTSNGCAANTCTHKDFGCQTATTCADASFGCKTYNSCVNDTCTCKVGNDCTLTENSYRTYTCPKGGTLSGTTCKF